MATVFQIVIVSQLIYNIVVYKNYVRGWPELMEMTLIKKYILTFIELDPNRKIMHGWRRTFYGIEYRVLQVDV